MTVRVGVIGAGTMGRHHALTIHRYVKGAVVTRVCEPNLQNAARLHREIPDATIAENPLDLISGEDVDAVIIASPDHTHGEFTEACIRHAKPVLCEKPLAETAEACRRIVAAESVPDAPRVSVGFMRRFDPAYQSLKAKLERATVGRPHLIRCIHRNKAAPHFFTGRMGISNAMVHEFDIIRWLTRAEPTQVLVSVPTTNNDRQVPILATVRFSDGALAEIEVFMDAGYGYDIRTEIIGSRGVLEMARHPSTFLGLNGEISATQCQDFIERFADAYRTMLMDWVAGINAHSGTSNFASSVDGLRAMEIAEAAVESLESGQWVKVPPLAFDNPVGQSVPSRPESDDAGP